MGLALAVPFMTLKENGFVWVWKEEGAKLDCTDTRPSFSSMEVPGDCTDTLGTVRHLTILAVYFRKPRQERFSLGLARFAADKVAHRRLLAAVG